MRPAGDEDHPPVVALPGAALELLVLGLGLTLVVGGLARLPSWYRELGAFQILFAIAFLFYLLAAARLSRYADLPRVGLVVFGVAAACRVLLAPLPPSLSGDLHRYVWEGMVWLNGGNPYLQAPNDPALASLRDAAIHPFVNHPHLSTIYPPLAEAGFAMVAWLDPSVLAMKIWVALHDLALVAVLMAWAARERGSAAWALLYAWNPLVLAEYAGTGHNDPTAMLFLALAFFWRKERPLFSGLALGVAALVKLAPLVALPYLWREWSWRARAAALVLVVPGLALFAALTRETYSGLWAYWGQWRNNELLFHLAERALGDFSRARALTLGVVAALAVWAIGRAWRADRATRATFGAALVTSPVVHPWYAGWVLMFVTPGVSWWWIAFSALLVLNYGWLKVPAEGRSFHAPLAWRWIEYGLPLAAAAIVYAVARRRTGGKPTDVP